MKKQAALCGVLASLALILSYIEALIPMPVPIPGIKLGLANVVTTLLLYLLGFKTAFTVSIIRIILAGFMFGNLFAILYSLSGGIFSIIVMYFFIQKKKNSVLIVSILGGISHNVAQLSMACLVVQNIHLFIYFPALLIAGIITGFLTGLIDRELLKRISRKEKSYDFLC